jgi:hypothetical protein
MRAHQRGSSASPDWVYYSLWPHARAEAPSHHHAPAARALRLPFPPETVTVTAESIDVEDTIRVLEAVSYPCRQAMLGSLFCPTRPGLLRPAAPPFVHAVLLPCPHPPRVAWVGQPSECVVGPGWWKGWTCPAAGPNALCACGMAGSCACPSPCSVGEWSERQAATCHDLAMDLEETWRHKFAGDLAEALEDHFNLYQREAEAYAGSPLRSLLVRACVCVCVCVCVC